MSKSPTFNFNIETSGLTITVDGCTIPSSIDGRYEGEGIVHPSTTKIHTI